MKNFSCLILGIGLLVNITMANLNENDAIDRVKRGSLKFTVSEKSISATKQSFIKAQIKTLYKDVSDGGKRGKIAVTLSDAMKKNFGGKWMVLICEKDEICSFTHGGLNLREYLKGWYGQTYWAVYGY